MERILLNLRDDKDFIEDLDSLQKRITSFIILIISSAFILQTLIATILTLHNQTPIPDYSYLLYSYCVIFISSLIVIKKFHFVGGTHLFMLSFSLFTLTVDLFSLNLGESKCLLYLLSILLAIILYSKSFSLWFSISFTFVYFVKESLISNIPFMDFYTKNIIFLISLFCLYMIKKWLSNLVNFRSNAKLEFDEATLLILGKVAEIKDSGTFNHLERVGIIMEEIAKKLQFTISCTNYITDNYIQDLKSAAVLHDIGKIGIPDNILLKSDKLTLCEFEIMKRHTVIGSELLNEARKKVRYKSIYDMAIDIARHHHEWWNGSGYPFNLRDSEIPLSARIMAVADVYDALVSQRPYKRSYSHEEAVEIIEKEAGTHFDPAVVKAFIKSQETINEKIHPLLDNKNDVTVTRALTRLVIQEDFSQDFIQKFFSEEVKIPSTKGK